MTPQLFSIEHAPPSLPIWHVITEDLAHPPVKRIARVLGLSRRTVYRYNKTGHAPRVVLLALFWLTRWGRSAVHTQATNDAVMACSLVAGLERRIGELTAHVGHLERLGGYGSSNQPLVNGPGYGGGLSPHGQHRPSSLQAFDLAAAPPAGALLGTASGVDARPGSLGLEPANPPPLASRLGGARTGAGVRGPGAEPAGRSRPGEAGPGPEGPPA